MPDLEIKADPLFVPGELVEIRDKDSEYYGKRFRVQKAIYKSWYEMKKRGYGRQKFRYYLPVKSDDYSNWWDEHELVKLHKDEECEWIDCAVYMPPGQFKTPFQEDDNAQD